jgi:hypothetical protein
MPLFRCLNFVMVSKDYSVSRLLVRFKVCK